MPLFGYYKMVDSLQKQRLTTTSMVIIVIVVAMGLMGVVAITIVTIAQQADAAPPDRPPSCSVNPGVEHRPPEHNRCPTLPNPR
jgi:predicted PurR-regulated permease PerM